MLKTLCTVTWSPRTCFWRPSRTVRTWWLPILVLLQSSTLRNFTFAAARRAMSLQNCFRKRATTAWQICSAAVSSSTSSWPVVHSSKATHQMRSLRRTPSACTPSQTDSGKLSQKAPRIYAWSWSKRTLLIASLLRKLSSTHGSRTVRLMKTNGQIQVPIWPTSISRGSVWYLPRIHSCHAPQSWQALSAQICHLRHHFCRVSALSLSTGHLSCVVFRSIKSLWSRWILWAWRSSNALEELLHLIRDKIMLRAASLRFLPSNVNLKIRIKCSKEWQLTSPLKPSL